MKEMGSVSVT